MYNTVNRHYTIIKFTTTWSEEKVTFLDTMVYLKEDGLIWTNLYTSNLRKKLSTAIWTLAIPNIARILFHLAKRCNFKEFDPKIALTNKGSVSL